MKLTLTLALVLATMTSIWAQVTDIATARTLPLGTVVTVQGIVLNSNELGGARYLQDATGGISSFPSSGSQANYTDSANTAVEIQITGTLSEFNGLLQVSPVTSYTVINANATVPAPAVVLPSAISETVESQLVEVENVVFDDAGATFAVGTYTFRAASNSNDSSVIYLRSGHPLLGETVPSGSIDVVGVVGEFNGTHQLLPRSSTDLPVGTGGGGSPTLMDIATARTQALGTVVTVQGVVLNSNELGGARYLQDATAGISSFPSGGSQANYTDSANTAVEIQITGEISQFNGLLQISPVTSYTVINANATLPTPAVVLPSAIAEPIESQLVTAEDVVFDDAGAAFAVGSYTFRASANSNDSAVVYLRNGHPLLGATVPSGSVDVTGVVGEFNGTHQLLPRSSADIMTNSGGGGNPTVMDIATARTQPLGTVVTVQGVVLNSDELGGARYFQDATAGISSFPASGSQANYTDSANTGVEIQVTGPISEFNGLLQVSPVTSYTVVNANATLPTPAVILPSDLGEPIESELVKVEGVTFDNAGATFASGTYTFRDDNNSSGVIFLRSNHPLLGTTIPLAEVDITGVVGEFLGTHQLLPRTPADIVNASNFFATSGTEQSNLTTTSFDLDWNTNIAGDAHYRYGLTAAYELGDVNASVNSANPTVTLSSLTAGAFYYVQPYSVNGTDTAWAQAGLYSTVSNSSGTIEVIFNDVVDVSFASGTTAQYLDGVDITARLIGMIDSAQSTIDFCGYNINRNSIVTALENAYNRGVQVRYIRYQGTANLALQNVAHTFPVLSGNTNGLMHNKFVVVDADDVNEAKVWTGSMNFTSNNIGDDPNNVVLIHDQAVAKCFTLEFEEMWGTDGPSFNVFNVKFGENKTDNTPHNFVIGGRPIEVYFSPTDNTTAKIEEALRSADTDVQVAVLSFTRNDLGQAIIDLHNAGINERVLMENINDQGSEFGPLTNAGVDILEFTLSKQLHHKYAIVDATDVASDPIVITGSHNWSTSAETRNDENTLIIHDATIANLFLQEFEARWCEQTNPSCTVGLEVVRSIAGLNHRLLGNPVSDVARLELNAAESMDVSWFLVDVNGQTIRTAQLGQVMGTQIVDIDMQNLPAGAYFLVLEAEGQAVAKQIIKR